MGILTHGLLSPTTGGISNLICRNTRFGNVISIKPRPSNKPATTGQVTTRAKFGLMSSFLSYIPFLVNPGFKKYSAKMYPMNAAISYNLKRAIKNDGTNLEIDYSKIVYSRGTQLAPDEPTVKTEEGQKVVFSWYQEKEDTAYNAETDEVYILTYSPEEHEFWIPATEVTRGDGVYILQFPHRYAGKLIHCYMSFASLTGKVSDSVYIGSVVVM